MDPNYTKASVISLKSHADLDERWLQDRIGEDPSVLGLGDLVLKDRERRQPRAGRLDLLLSDPETKTRYVTEVQLGATDESHMFRAIEYWEIERARWPQYEHVAVLVAEDVTSRFLNVISLLNNSIPMVAIQVQALRVGDTVTLNSTIVRSPMPLGLDEEDEPSPAADRADWERRGYKPALAVIDELLHLANEVSPGHTLRYTQQYVGLSQSGSNDSWVVFRPRKGYALTEFRIARSEDLTAHLEESGIDALSYDPSWGGRYRVRITRPDLVDRRKLLLELFARASGRPIPGGAPTLPVTRDD